MRLSSMLRLAAVCAIAVFQLRAEATPDSLVRQVEDRYNGARTLSVQFVETYSIQGHMRPSEAGTLTLRKQGKMRWDYTRPEGKLFVSDGKTVYLYTARDNRVEKVPLRDTEDMRAPLAFLLGHLEMKKEFKDFKTQPGDGGTWLTASAKSDRVPYDKVDMLVAAGGEIRELKVAGRDDSVMTFVFQGERVNPPVSDAMFHFTVPPGAEVVDAMEFEGRGK